MTVNVAVFWYMAKWLSRRKPLSHSSVSKMEASVSTEKLVQIYILAFFSVRRWNQRFPPLCWHLSTNLHSVISHKAVILNRFRNLQKNLKNPHDLQKRINLRRRHLLEKRGFDQLVHKSPLRFRTNYCEAYRVVTWRLVWGLWRLYPQKRWK